MKIINQNYCVVCKIKNIRKEHDLKITLQIFEKIKDVLVLINYLISIKI